MGAPCFKEYRESKLMSQILELYPLEREESSLNSKNYQDFAENSNAEFTQKNDEQLAPEFTAPIQESNVHVKQQGKTWQYPNEKNFEEAWRSMSQILELYPLEREESSLYFINNKDFGEDSNAEITKKNDEQLAQELTPLIQESNANVEQKGTAQQYPNIKNSEDDKNRGFGEDPNAEFTQKNDEQLAPTFTAPFQEQLVVKVEQNRTTRQTPSVKNSEDDKNKEKKKKLKRKRKNSSTKKTDSYKKHNKNSKDNMMQKLKTNIMEYKIFNRLNGSLKNKEYKFYRLHKALNENLKKKFNQKLLKTTIRELFYHIKISDKYGPKQTNKKRKN